ncbi:bifunctional DNA-formamidopyrimidine glycosylase/DNA-(apurinic or apyrimidinic site) lyase [Candidatus Woesearchaeota archaeon]|nr:bifunctional DNA-formamidopyrimidine glycosylase/DNA-(apurinic or apyrimidinic site) lyase [Candidatus Woesearchaeota archaeon]
MPELPEVETIVQQLKKKLVGKKINYVEVLDKKVVDNDVKKISGSKVVKVWRRAKSIIIELSGKKFLLVHLRMTGHFHYVSKGKKLDPFFEKFVVARFNLSDGSMLTHNSIRLFGSIRLLSLEELEKELSKLGPEPLEISFKEFEKIILGKKGNVKTTIMDQKVIVGIGNIYAQEALYWAGIDPSRKCGDLSFDEIKKLYNQIKRVLLLAIKHHGTTIENYAHIEGAGDFQKLLAVYQSKKCPKKHLLKKISLGGRGTYYCSQCQK